MNLKTLLPQSVFLKSIFVFAVFLLIFISSIAYKHTVALNASTNWVMHSYKVHVELERLFSLLKDAETGQRGFIITKDTVFLQPYVDAGEKVNESLNTLKLLTADNSLQQRNLDTISHLIKKRFGIFANSLALNSAVPFSAERLNYSVIQGKNIMDIIRNRVNNMINLEKAYLTQRKETYDNTVYFTPLFTLLLLLFSMVVFVFSYLKINKDFDILKKSNAALFLKTESIKQAEKIGEFGTTVWNFETNELIFSDNLYLLLGHTPQSFESTGENYIKFVHPDDRHIITDGAESLLAEGKTSPRYYRIIRADGNIRYFKSMRRIYSDTTTNTHIGIILDVTDAHLVTLSLEEKNRELERSNKELASFNHIASHDLQEPLRKIQTFISRIDQKESTNLSETGREYFAKIKTSANRMRLLIDDLLLFSHTNKAEKKFELTDLNTLLDNSKQELSETIIEKNAVLKSVTLPELQVIPFQIQQLFINLISNSLKYSKSNDATLIAVDCAIIVAKDQPLLKINTNKKYYKISIADNGLGFEQQYAENIFNLFYRLHHTNEYVGTGIGLAICKKIVENHAGFIFAEGIPDKGATFMIFLPIS
jgi:signal transduction histidine kinase/CHASE3 domain sensor protein